MAKNLLIIGGVAAGTKAAAKARRDNPELEITLITDDEHITYAGCGLPYYIGDVIKKRDDLWVMTPDQFSQRNRVSVLTRYRATSIDPVNRMVTADNLTSRKTLNFSYDKLLISTGARPILPPLPGINIPGVFTLRSVSDAFRIKDWITTEKVRNAVIVGGGYIGLEMSENLTNIGIKTTIIEMASYVLPNYDNDVSSEVRELLESNGVTVHTNSPVKGFGGTTHLKSIHTDLNDIPAEIAIVSIGIKPNTDIAKEAGIKIGETGAISVNARMETSVENIYAAGDCAENIHLVTGKPVWVPLGSTANKMGRAAAINITGRHASLEGILGTSILKVFNWFVAKTGLTMENAQVEGIDAAAVTITANDHAGYYPGAEKVNVKLIAEKNTGKLIGGEVYGPGVVDKPIDIIATALYFHANVEDLSKLDLAYCPPVSTALSNVTTAAHVFGGKYFS